MYLFLSVISALITFGLITALRAYQDIPLTELRRRARAKDPMAMTLYRAAAYRYSLKVLLWFFIGLSAGTFFVTTSKLLPIWLALLVAAIVIWLAFVTLPAHKSGRPSRWLARHLAPLLAWFLNYLHPLIDKFHSWLVRNQSISVHTGLYTIDDLVDLIERQQVQADNRIEQSELNIAQHALKFGELKVADCLTPRRMVYALSKDDPIGPVLMTELHDSGHSRFPVFEGDSRNLVGVLYYRDLLKAKNQDTVGQAMHKDVTYVHESDSLNVALQAVLKTRQHLLIVVNSFEEYLGVISLEDIIEKIIGQQIVDEFDQYEDLRAVANKLAKVEHSEHQDQTAAKPEDS